jgi:predicted small secreted protein
MRKLTLGLLASAALLAGCNTVRGVASDIEAVADAFDPARTYAACGTYGMVDRNNDARIGRDEWLAYGGGAFASWDGNGNGRIGRGEFANCWYGGGFATTYNRQNWQPAFDALDVNNDGVITANEFFSATAWARLDPNGTGYITAWPWT